MTPSETILEILLQSHEKTMLQNIFFKTESSICEEMSYKVLPFKDLFLFLGLGTGLQSSLRVKYTFTLRKVSLRYDN